MKRLILICCIGLTSLAFGQEDDELFLDELEEETEEPKWKKYFSLSGYIKYMNTNSFVKTDSIFTDNLIHNRLNFKVTPNNRWTFSLELRNRLFWGESVKLNPLYADWIDQDNGEVDLSFNIAETNSLVFNSTIDRLNVEYNIGKWNFRIGRQRINWGINMAWNPNDLFNAYNFVDFDYQERPGSDAIRIRYYPTATSRLEVACKPGENLDQSIVAGLYQFNKKEYDFQVLGGNYLTDLTAGFGWAGNIWKIGFKGEASYFHPKQSFLDTSGVLSASVSLDYMFESGLFMTAGGLYNSGAAGGAGLFQLQSSFSTLSAKNLMPTEWSVIYQLSGAITPLFGAGLATMYLPRENGFFFIPTLSYSILENWDLDFVGQLLFADLNNKFQNVSNGLFLRIRWSY